MGNAVIFSGSAVKALKKEIKLGSGASVISGTIDPTSSAVSAVAGSLYQNETTGKIYRKLDAGSSTNWVEIKESTAKNYILNPDATLDTTGWSVYKDVAGALPVDGTGTISAPNITWTRTTSSPLSGAASFLLTKPITTNCQGEGVSYDFTIDLGDDNGGVFVASCSYMPTSGTFSGGSETTDSDVTVYIVSKEFGTVIQPSYYKLQASVNGKAAKSTAYFQLPVSAGGGSARQFRLCYHVATVSTAAYTVKLDEVSVGPSAGAGVQSAQNLCSYTHGGGQTINTSWATILFGTKTVDDNALYNTGTGVLTFSEAGDYTVFASMLSSGVTLSTSQSVQIRVRKNGSDVLCQSVTYGNGALNSYGVITGKTFRVNAGDYIEVQGYSDSSTTTSAGAAMFNYFSVVKESSTSSSVYPSISMSAGKTTGSHTASGSWQDVTSWDSPLMDRGGNFNATTGVYTINEPGDYDVYGTIVFSTNATGIRAARIYHNNSVSHSGGEIVASSSASVPVPFAQTIPCISGDTLRIQAFQNSGGSLSYASSYSSLSICKRQSSQISPSEKIAAKYTSVTADAIGTSLATLTYPTKVFDTHNAYSSGFFTAPSPGKYFFKASVITNPVTLSTGQALAIEVRKNSSTLIDSAQTIGNGASNYWSVQTSGFIELNYGETVDVQVKSSVATSVGASASYNTFEIFRI